MRYERETSLRASIGTKEDDVNDLSEAWQPPIQMSLLKGVIGVMRVCGESGARRA
jgi:hypothetical protein